MRDPKREPWPGDVLVFDNGFITTQHVVEEVTPTVDGLERRVVFEDRPPVTMRRFRKWTSNPNLSIELEGCSC